MERIALVVIKGGVASVYASPDVNYQVIDLDNLDAGDPPVDLPVSLGFEQLVEDACLDQGEHYLWI